MIFRFRLAGVYKMLRKYKGENVAHLFQDSVPARFSAIYKNRVWLCGRSCGSLSGLGSDLENTETIRRELPELLKFLGTEVLLDIGCGEFGWMREVALPCQYIGIDVVEEIVEQNRASWSSDQRSFFLLDAMQEPLPPADTALCREVLFHLSFHDIWRVIENVRRSGCSILIATNDIVTEYNADISSGDFRILNLRRKPFCFPVPVRAIQDCSVVPGRTLSVWRVEDLPRKH